MWANGLVLLLALLDFAKRGYAQGAVGPLRARDQRRAKLKSCTFIIEGLDDWKEVDDPRIKAEVTCEEAGGPETLYNETQKLTELEAITLKEGFTLFGEYEDSGKAYVLLGNERERWECLDCQFNNLPAFPETSGGSPAPVVVAAGRMQFFDTKFKNNGRGYNLAGGAYFTGNTKIGIINSTFEDCSGEATGAFFMDEGSNVDVEDSYFLRNKGNIYSGAIHLQNRSHVRLEIVDFIGAEIPEELKSYARGEAETIPPGVKIPIAGAISVYDTAQANVEDAIFDDHGGQAGTIHTTHTSLLVMRTSFFRRNFAGSGGGVYIEGDTGHHARIFEATFEDNVARNGGGLVILGEGGLLLVGNLFSRNIALLGGGIFSDFALPGTKEYETCEKAEAGSEIDIEESTFLNNSAIDSGGAVHSRCTKVGFKQGYMAGNKAGKFGGAILIDTGVELDVERVPFEDNKAIEGSGSSIYAVNTKIVDVQDCKFADNEVVFEGGGTVSVEKSVSIVVKNCEFERNKVKTSGGALWFKSTTNVTISNSTFLNNSADGSGGAIWGDGVSELVELEKVVIDNNVAGSGAGALVITNGADAIVETVMCTNNTGKDGDIGCLSLSGSGVATAFDIMILENKVDGSCGGAHFGGFEDILLVQADISLNVAGRNGGGLCFEEIGNLALDSTVNIESNEAGEFGGAIHLVGSSGFIALNQTSFQENAAGTAVIMNAENITEFAILGMLFEGHSATTSCGVLRLSEAKIVELEDVKFIDNQAMSKDGGALCLDGVKEFALLGDTAFTGNLAKEVGGAIHVTNSGVLKLGNTPFEGNQGGIGGAIGGRYVKELHGKSARYADNKSDKNGGGISLDGIDKVVLEEVEFMSNTAGGGGGAVWFSKGDKVKIVKSGFFGNSAGRDGGGILAEVFDEMMLKDIRMNNNSAQGSGGGIYSARIPDLVLLDSKLIGNAVKRMGGAVELVDTKMTGTNLEFVENHADSSGGAFLCKGNSKVKVDEADFTHNYARSGQSLAAKCSCTVNVTDSAFRREKGRSKIGNFFDIDGSCSKVLHSGCIFVGAPDKPFPRWLLILIVAGSSSLLLCCILFVACAMYRRRKKKERRAQLAEAAKYDSSRYNESDEYEDGSYYDSEESPRSRGSPRSGSRRRVRVERAEA